MPFAVPKLPRRSLLRWLLLMPLVPLLWWLKNRRPDPDANKLRMTAIDVGQGDSTLFQTPGGRVLLIDGGGTSDEASADETDVGDRVVLPYLRSLGINRIDVLVLTHPHGDHVGGLSAVLREIEVGVILDGTTLPYPSPAYTQFLALAEKKNIPIQRAVRGMRLDLGSGVTADVLNPPATTGEYGTEGQYGTGTDDATINNYSASLCITYGQTHFVLTGDAENAAELSMLAAFPSLSADVLKAGHHGAGNASGDDWLSQIAPTYAAISCGRHNRFGHPHPATLARLAAHDVQTLRTDHSGALFFVSDGRAVTARAYLV